MARNLKRIFKSLIQQINKSALHMTENITERSQNKISILQHHIFKKLSNILKQLNSFTFVENLKTTSLQTSHPLPKYITNYWQCYQELIGLNKVDVAKQQVIVVQDKVFECQNQRRILTQQIFLINGKLKEIYSELIQTKRDDPKYVHLTILENKSLQEHSRISEQLEILENQERDNFTQLATSIKEYHDCQMMNNQKFKYLSIIASTILAIFSLIGSMIYNHKIISEIRNVIISGEKSMENNLNNKFLKLTNIIQQQNSLLNALNLQTIELLHNNEIKKFSLNLQTNRLSNNKKKENFIPNVQGTVLSKNEIIKKTSYCIGFGCLAIYIMCKIFVS